MMVSPTKASPRVGLAAPYAGSRRVSRRPAHSWTLKFRPYDIQPFALAPVLPGESLKNALCQGQIWSDPLASGMKNTGWWFELFLFYVKHRDLQGWEIGTDGIGKDMIDMFVTNEDILTPYEVTARDPQNYACLGGINYTRECMIRIVEEYFRDEGELAGGGGPKVNGTVFKAQLRGRGQGDAFERLTTAAAYQDRRQKLDYDNDGTIYVGDEIDRAYAEWAAAHDAGLVDMDYEDWMRSYGGGTGYTTTPDRVDMHRPELLGHVREFAYPTNTVDPVTGTPAVAVGWRLASRLGKSFFFPEPGWIVGVVLTRPKVYFGNQEGSVATMMTNRNAWLPPQRNDEATVSHLLIPQAKGPLSAQFPSGGYWVDLRDLLNYGDQFVNYLPSQTTDPQMIALPLPAERKYVDSVDVDQLFKTTTAGTGVFNGDGVLSLTILGRQSQAGVSNLVLGRA